MSTEANFFFTDREILVFENLINNQFIILLNNCHKTVLNACSSKPTSAKLWILAFCFLND